MKDGLQGISHDRILIRLVNYLQIVGGIGGLIGMAITIWWASIQIVRMLDRMNQQISLLQQQVSTLQQITVTRKN